MTTRVVIFIDSKRGIAITSYWGEEGEGNCLVGLEFMQDEKFWGSVSQQGECT